MKTLLHRRGLLARGLTVGIVLFGVTSTALGQAAATQVGGISQPAVSPELQAAMQAVADARKACDSLKEKLLAAAPDSVEYARAKAALAAALADLARAETAVPRSNENVAALAQKEMVDANAVSKLEQQVLGASPEWQAANAKLEAANKSLDTVRISLAADQARQQQEAVARLRQQQQAAAEQQQQVNAAAQQQEEQREEAERDQALNDLARQNPAAYMAQFMADGPRRLLIGGIETQQSQAIQAMMQIGDITRAAMKANLEGGRSPRRSVRRCFPGSSKPSCRI